jgi:NAD(P)-dependent dehydrogenase (short-subunit alcohol dehydrogenase family)
MKVTLCYERASSSRGYDLFRIFRTFGAFGSLDIVLANAGFVKATPLGATSLDDFEEILRVNVTSVFATLQLCLPHLNDGASLILNGSVMSINGRPGFAAYAASKGAIRAMARVMASELSPRRIRVNVVIPGSIDTPIWCVAADNPEAMKALYKRLETVIPLGQMGKAEEVADAVLFLASTEASFIQAAEIVVDGGATGAPLGAIIFRQQGARITYR